MGRLRGNAKGFLHCSAANVARNQEEDETCQEVRVGSAHGGKARPSTAERARILSSIVGRWREKGAQAWVCLSLACGPPDPQAPRWVFAETAVQNIENEGGKRSISVYAGVSFRELWSFLI